VRQAGYCVRRPVVIDRGPAPWGSSSTPVVSDDPSWLRWDRTSPVLGSRLMPHSVSATPRVVGALSPGTRRSPVHSGTVSARATPGRPTPGTDLLATGAAMGNVATLPQYSGWRSASSPVALLSKPQTQRSAGVEPSIVEVSEQEDPQPPVSLGLEANLLQYLEDRVDSVLTGEDPMFGTPNTSSSPLRWSPSKHGSRSNLSGQSPVKMVLDPCGEENGDFGWPKHSRSESPTSRLSTMHEREQQILYSVDCKIQSFREQKKSLLDQVAAYADNSPAVDLVACLNREVQQLQADKDRLTQENQELRNTNTHLEERTQDLSDRLLESQAKVERLEACHNDLLASLGRPPKSG